MIRYHPGCSVTVEKVSVEAQQLAIQKAKCCQEKIFFLILALLYFVSPIDLVPMIPIDDIIVVSIAAIPLLTAPET